MILPSLIAGFTLGAAGSLHCVGMCGPLSMALPTWHLSPTAKFLSLLLYQAGRVITYSFFGLIFGIAGRGLYLAGMQQWFSIIAGTLIFIAALFYFIQKHSTRFFFFHRFYQFLQVLIVKIVKRNSSPGGFLLLGMANGLLPCGMVYMAIAATLSFTHLGQSIGFMAMFGAGTLPAMMFVGYSSQVIRPSVRKLFKQSVPYVITIIGVLLILRGLNLGITFISPRLPEAAAQAVSCSH